ncbi:MAG TPA: peptidyl-prolyl cis-trans isomerase [Candidatus Sulfomarinibacteraceae bacterium]|nr:peptidyl-prolyl cis-trans isomerase [Candidatus Sulfomarinibacteraceae bacterium]
MALKWLRDNLRHLKFILWGVVAVFVLLVFVDWGAGGAGGGGGTDAAVQIGDTAVSRQQFLNQMRLFEQRYSQQFGEQWNEIRDQVDLFGETMGWFTNRLLLLDEAERAGIRVSEEELREDILSTPIFQDESGTFVGAETYERIIRAYFQMSPREYEKSRSEDLVIAKLTALMRRGIYVGEAEVERSIRRDRELADFDVVMLPYERFLSEVSIGEDEALAHYQATTDRYHRDEQRVIRYLVVETSRLRRQLPVEEAELRAYYQENVDAFVEGEQARAAHVLIRVPADATAEVEAEAEARARGVAEIARAGGDFAALAAKHSDDPGSRDTGGDLGWFGRGRMVPEFEEAVFDAKPGDIVGPVRSQFGFHVIEVEGFRPERQRPFEEVEEQVRFRVLEGRAAVEAEQRARELAGRLVSDPPADDAGWQAIADEDEAVVLNESPPVTESQTIPGTGDSLDLTLEVFAGEEGAVSGPRAIPRGWMVWQLKEVRPEGVAPFEDVRAQVEQSLRRQLALEVAAERAAELAERWRQGEDVEALVESSNGVIARARDHRWGAPIGTIGAAAGLDEAVFAGAEGEILGPVRIGDRGSAVARIETLRLIGEAELDRERDPVRSRLVAERAERLLVSILNERRRDTVVTADPQFRQNFAPRG